MKYANRLLYELNSEELICTILQKGHDHDADEWRDYDEDNVPFERLEKVYVPDEDSLEQRINIFHGQLYSLYSQGERYSQISSSPSALFLIKSRSVT